MFFICSEMSLNRTSIRPTFVFRLDKFYPCQYVCPHHNWILLNNWWSPKQVIWNLCTRSRTIIVSLICFRVMFLDLPKNRCLILAVNRLHSCPMDLCFHLFLFFLNFTSIYYFLDHIYRIMNLTKEFSGKEENVLAVNSKSMFIV
jgi:hypothetical protein